MGALKKTLKIREDRSYQTQYFAKIFSSPLALMLHIHFYLHLQESSENTLWIVIPLKNETFSAPQAAHETTYFTQFFKLLTKNLEKKMMMEFHKHLFLLHAIIKEYSPAMHGWRKIVFMKPNVFSPETFTIICFC